MGQNKVLVIIVTYNRLNDLKDCISALQKQTYKDFDILVVNNGSTDGTKEWLDSQEFLHIIHQDNLGGAGGFYSGMKYMVENRYSWLLMMDDDGIADKDELKNLMEGYSYVKEKEGKDIILNALVANKDDHSTTAFMWARGSGRSNNIQELKKEIYFKDIHPFNGTLVKREIIEKIGLIKKEMFIWGDEEEYMARARYYGFGTCTLTSAIHYHPKEKGQKGNLIPFCKKYFILVKPAKMSHFFYRNKGYIYSTYPEKRKHIIPFVLSNLIYDICHFRFGEMVKFAKYFRRGTKNNYE
jgi:rhamnopyranosyl-N-acetylglucosaminyl-diphospho-decaprenol beta-1,3/1,4-galactofuranosyltransferase